jgi:hypothetical protein
MRKKKDRRIVFNRIIQIRTCKKEKKKRLNIQLLVLLVIY